MDQIIPIRRAPTADEPVFADSPSCQRSDFLERYYGAHRAAMLAVAKSKLSLAKGRLPGTTPGDPHGLPQENCLELLLQWVGNLK